MVVHQLPAGVFEQVVYYLGVPSPSVHRPALVGISARTPIGAGHGALSGWHPIDLLAHVLDAALKGCASEGIELSDIDRVILANATAVGALSTPRRSLAIAGHWSGQIEGLEIASGGASGHQALTHAGELVANRLADNVLVCAIDMASVVPPGAPLLRRDYGKPLTPTSVRELTANGGHLPDGPYGDTLGFTREDVDARVAASLEAATAWPTTATPTTSSINDPERATPYQGPEFSVDEPLRRGTDGIHGLEPMFAADGLITAMSLAQPGDGAVAMLVSAAVGGYRLGESVSRSGSPSDPLTPMADAVSALAVDGTRLVATEPSAAHALALADRLGIDQAVVNNHGGAVARGRLFGAEALQGLHDAINSSELSAITMLSATGDGAALATQVHPS